MSRSPHRRWAPGVVFSVSFAVLLGAMLVWSFATPLFAGPDEPVHVIKAAALVRGQLLGRLDTTPGQQEFAEVHVPGFYSVDRAIPKCFAHKPLVAASCAPPPPVVCRHPAGSKAPPCGIAFVYNARYPPLYYAVVGLPTLLGESAAVLYLMRALSAALCAAFLALAMTAALCWSATRLLLAGLVIAMTPMVVYLGGVVNPSSLEIAAAICVWTTGVIVVLERPHDAPVAAIAALAVSSCVFEAMRSLSPFWLGLTALVLLGVADRPGLRALVRRRAAQVGLLAVAAVGMVAVVWILKEHATDVLSTSSVPVTTPELNILEESFRHNVYYLPTMVGVFGEFDTFAPSFTYIIWYALTGFVALAAMAAARGRRAVVILLVAVAIVVVPVAISSSQAHRYGYTWNGRDTLPFAVGLPLLAAFLLGRAIEARATEARATEDRATEDRATEDRASGGRSGVPRLSGTDVRRLVGIVALLAGLAQVVAFYEALRRYAVGTAGPVFGFLEHSSWNAPGGNATLVVLDCLVVLLAGLLVTRAAGRSGPGPPPGGEAVLAGAPVTGAPVTGAPVTHGLGSAGRA